MQDKRRWMTSVVREAAKAKIDMPWARGPKRQAAIARRKAAEARRSDHPARA
jgi:hypothetical protein